MSGGGGVSWLLGTDIRTSPWLTRLVLCPLPSLGVLQEIDCQSWCLAFLGEVDFLAALCREAGSLYRPTFTMSHWLSLGS